MKPLTRGQKIVAYSSLLLVALCTLFGLFTIWLYLNEF
jgi:hypothetical protein